MKVYGNLEAAALESLASDPSGNVTGRVWWNSTDSKARLDDGTLKRALLRNDQGLVIGNSATAAENIRLNRSGVALIQFLLGNDVTAEGSPSAALAKIGFKLEDYTNAGLPAAGNAGRIVYVSDQLLIKLDDGTAFRLVQGEKLATDAATTGANATLAAFTQTVVRLTNSSLTSIDMIPAGLEAQRLVLINHTGNSITINDNTGGTAANRILTGTKINVTLADEASLFLVYDTTESRWMVVGGTGSGGGSNFSSLIQGQDATFEGGIGAWTLYNDSSEIPVDGTGGTVTGVTFTENTSTPINGTSSGRLSKDAANRQGTGVALPLTVSDKFKNKPCKIKLFTRGSANFDFGSDESSDPGDVMFYLYDVTNSQLIYLSPRNVDGSGVYESLVFMSGASSVRLLAHIRSTNALAWDFDIDDVTLEVATNPFLNNMSDWISYTPTGAFTTNTTYVGYYRRVGDSMEVIARANFSGAPNAVTNTLNLPSGFVIDTTKLVSTSTTPNTFQSLGTAKLINDDAAVETENLTGHVVLNSTTAVSALALDPTSGATHYLRQITNTNPISIAANDYLEFNFKVPIVGWTSGALVPTQIGQNFPAFFGAKKTADQAVTNGVTTKVTFDSIQNDNLGGWDSTNNRYVVKVAGHYCVSASLFTAATAAQGAVARVYKNGSEIYSNFNRVDSANQANPSLCTPPIQMNIGDYFELFGTVNAGSLFGSSFFTFLGVTKVDPINSQPGLNKIAYLKDEKSAASSGGAFTSGAWQTRTLNTEYDNYGIVSLSANQFTLQAGTYRISASAPAYFVDRHQTKIRNITDSSDIPELLGTSAYAISSSGGDQTISVVNGIISISSAKTFELQHRCAVTNASNGFGVESNFGVNSIYAQVEIEKIA